MRVEEWLFRSFAAVFLLVPIFALAQGQGDSRARSVSPDGNWEFRSGAAGEQGDFVIAKAASDDTALVLSEEEYVDGLANLWVERLTTQTSFGHRIQNALPLTFSRAIAFKRRSFINSTERAGESWGRQNLTSL